MLLRGLLPGYAFLALLWVASAQVPRLNALWLGACTLVLALPMMLALWHQGTVRRLVALHQFQSGRGLHRWGSRRALGILWRAALAILLSAIVLLQSVFFGRLEWLLLGLAPPFYLAARRAIDAVTAAQFTHPIYGTYWSSRTAQWLVAFVLAFAWVAASILLAEAPALPYAERIHQLQSGWAQAPSGTVKWVLDAGAWGQASFEALGQQAGPTSWRMLLALVIAPVSVFSYLALSLSGLALPVTEIRRTLGERLTADPSPPPVGAARAALLAAVACIVGLVLFQSLGVLDHHLRTADSPLAIRLLPECERIDGKVYALNTANALKALIGQAQDQLAGHQATACAKLGEIEALAARGVEQYLDWYFSLGAEWTRFATLLTGDIDLLLQAKFSEKVMSSPEIVQRLPAVQAAYEAQWALLVGMRSGALDLLDRNRLVLDARGCKVIKESSATPWTAQWEGSKARLVSGAGTGLIAGALAAKATAKAMGRTTMKSAGTVLTKATARKGIGKAGAAAVGATVGTVVAPGLGTVVGAAIGAGVGLAVGVSIDMVALAAEEKLTREDMRKDLLSAVSESLQPYRETFDCNALGKGAGPGPR
jgi:hypothetical protein